MALKDTTNQYLEAWGTKHVPTAEVVVGKLPIREYSVFALLGWVEQRPNTWPIVGVRLTVLSKEFDSIRGALNMGLPLTPQTERHVCGFLEDLGWDGRVWPWKDHGWPEATEHETSILDILRGAKMGATLTFPPQEIGTPTVNVPVLHSKKPYSVAPFREGYVPKHLETLRTIAANPVAFRSDWA